MIIWIASYPKSGNTWLRAIMSQVIFNNDIKDDNWISDIHKHIDSYPKFKHFKNLNSEFVNKNKLTKEETIKNWLNSQQLINQNKNIKIFKTHNMFCTLRLDNSNFSFTNLENTLGVIYIVRDPRNVITSLKNHFFLKSYDDAFYMITDFKRWIGILENEIPQAISSWEDHFKSWNFFY
jgi:Sulfotransferase domain.